LHQIVYDEDTRASLEAGFLPLENSDSPRPDWFEFHPIRHYLHSHDLDERTWYGFLSPKFTERTGVTAQELVEFLEHFDAFADVALVSHGWDQIAYFLNPFEQGEAWHPGLIAATREFLREAGIAIDLGTYIAHSQNAVFSNYVIAKPTFWRQWLVLADQLFDLSENGPTPLRAALAASGRYSKGVDSVQMKVFLQERLAPLVLTLAKFRVAVADTSARNPLHAKLFQDDPRTRRLLAACDTLKIEFTLTGDPKYIEMFRQLRAAIQIRPRTRPG
jgi:hypothetical protein